MIYTSGSTGQPKGVLCEHEGAVNKISYYMQEYLDIGEIGAGVVGFPLNTVFDGSIRTIFFTLGSGLILSLDSKKCTFLNCAPPMSKIYHADTTIQIRALSVECSIASTSGIS